MMKCSVAMATYNGERYIEDQLASILNQSVAVDEIVIVDDGSTDATVDIIARLQEQYPIIQLYRNETNLGYKDNFRKALSLAGGEYIFLCDQDDIWLPNKVADVLQAFAQTQADVICTQYQFIDAAGLRIVNPAQYEINGEAQRGHGRYHPISTQSLVLRNEYPGCTCCMHHSIRDVFLQIESPLVHDRAILLLGSLLGGTVFYNGLTVQYRLHGKNSIGLRKRTGKFMVRPGVIKKMLKPCQSDVLSFLRQARHTVTIKRFWWYHTLCQLQVPHIYTEFKIM